MAFTTEALESNIPSASANNTPELPSREFVGYDPKGTTSVTGSPLTPTAAPKQEPAAEETPTPSEESVTLSPKATAQARREQAFRDRERALKQREQDLSAKLSESDRFEQIKAKLAAKDFSAAEELGITYEEFTNHLLAKQAKSDPQEERFSKLQQELESVKKSQEEQTVKEYEANQSLWKQVIAKTVKESDEFSTIRELGAEDIVLQHVNDSFEEDGIELSVEDAAKEIEEALLARAEKFAAVSKVQSKLAKPALGAPKQGAKTITQNMTVTSQKPVTKPFHMLSESEQIAEAIRRVQAAKQNR